MSGPHSYSGQSHDGSRRFELRIVGPLMQVRVLLLCEGEWLICEEHEMICAGDDSRWSPGFDAPDWMRWMIRTMAENLRPMP